MFCNQCGKAMAIEHKFCSGCGMQAQVMPSGISYMGQENLSGVNYQQPQTNTMAVLGLIFAFFMPVPLGVIFSIIGIVNANKMNGEGRGLAIAGLIISVISVIITVLVILWMTRWWNDIASNFPWGTL